MNLQIALLSAFLLSPAVAVAGPAAWLAPAPAPVAVSGGTALRLNRFVGVESQAPRGADAYSKGLQRELDENRQGSAYGVAYAPVAPHTQLFARFGYGGGSGLDRANTGVAWKYGAGAQYSADSRNGFRADFTRYDSGKTRPKANVFSLGFVQKF